MISKTILQQQLKSTHRYLVMEEKNDRSQSEDLNAVCASMDTLEISPKPDLDAYFAFLPNDDGDTMLHNAIIEQDESLALYLINIAESSEWLNFKNSLSQTPLHLAVLTNQLTVARRLVVGGASLKIQDRNLNTPLHLASMKGLVMMMHTLTTPVRYLETKENKYDFPCQSMTENMNIYNFEGLTCAHIAAMHGYNQILKMCIQCGANMNAQELKGGRTTLHIACAKGDTETVKMLYSSGSCDASAKAYDGCTPVDLLKTNISKPDIL